MSASRSVLLKKLREIMQNHSYVPQTLGAYIIPHNDAHQSEYIAPCDTRREFISGFSGSRGTAVVTLNKAALWTDGRYFLQAEKELNSDWILMKEGLRDTPSIGDWLSKVLLPGDHVGVDPTLMPFNMWKILSQTLIPNGCNLVIVTKNLIDVLWENKPSLPTAPIISLPVEYTGETWHQKIEKIRSDMENKNVSILMLTALDDIAWLLNLRGGDITYNPVFFSYLIITSTEINLFVHKEKLTKPAMDNLANSNGLNLKIHDYNEVWEYFRTLISRTVGKVWLTYDACCGLVLLVPKVRRLLTTTPAATRKAVKNAVEIKGMKNAHVKDAVSLCEFFCWLEENVGKESITEISAAQKLEELHNSQEHFMGLSFETISCVGSNAAIIHYQPKKNEDKVLTKDQIYLCDSGGQYLDGTTDITRTWHFGRPSQYEKECYTRVVKGAIALSTVKFPPCTVGNRIDAFARASLWEVGLDYLHGTGHGVGMYLCVHEGPMGIHYRQNLYDTGLVEGMILSIEPGYYEDGKFGIRIENLAVVVKTDTKYQFRNENFLTFEVLTLVPIQTKMLEPSILTEKEIKWINDYHIKCRDTTGEKLKSEGKMNVYQWLMKETEPIG